MATRLPAQDLSRARAFYAEKLGLEPVEERPGGLRYRCGNSWFVVFQSAGAASGTHTQMGWEVADLEAVVAELRVRGVVFEEYDLPGIRTVNGIAQIAGNYPSKGGTGEKGAWFRNSEGNLHDRGGREGLCLRGDVVDRVGRRGDIHTQTVKASMSRRLPPRNPLRRPVPGPRAGRYAAVACALKQRNVLPQNVLWQKVARCGTSAAARDRGWIAKEEEMKKLTLKPEQLRVESFPVQNLRAEESGMMTPGVTLCLPYTCPECPYTRNVLCY